MSNRHTLSAIAILALAAAAAPGLNAQQPGGPPPQGAGQAPAGGGGFRGQQQPQGPRPYAEVITSKAVSDTVPISCPALPLIARSIPPSQYAVSW